MSVFHNLGGGSSASKKDIVESLQYSGLGIIEKNTWDEICDTLATHFPQMFFDTSSDWDVDTLSGYGQCSRDNEKITFSSAYADGNTAYCETSNIPCESCNKMKIVGTASCTNGSIYNNATITISNDDAELYTGTIEAGGTLDFEIDVPASQYLKISTYGRYQETSVSFEIYLYNAESALMVERISDKLNHFTGETGLMTLNQIVAKIDGILSEITSHKTRARNLYYYCKTITEIRNPLDLSEATDFYGFCFGCAELTYVAPLKTSNGTDFTNLFNNCTKLVTVAGVDFSKTSTATRLSNAFSNCYELMNLTVNGTIPANFDLSDCTKLTHESIMCVINALKDISGTNTTLTLTLGTENLAKLSDIEKAIATQKGWTLA